MWWLLIIIGKDKFVGHRRPVSFFHLFEILLSLLGHYRTLTENWFLNISVKLGWHYNLRLHYIRFLVILRHQIIRILYFFELNFIFQMWVAFYEHLLICVYFTPETYREWIIIYIFSKSVLLSIYLQLLICKRLWYVLNVRKIKKNITMHLILHFEIYWDFIRSLILYRVRPFN